MAGNKKNNNVATGARANLFFQSIYGFWRPDRCQVIHWNRDCGDLHLGFARVAPLKAVAHVFRPASLQGTGQSLSAQGGRLAEIRRYKPKHLPVRGLGCGPLPGELIKKANLNSWLGILKTLAADHLQA